MVNWNMYLMTVLTFHLVKRFRTFFAESGKTADVVGYIVLCCLELKDNPGTR